MTVSYELAFLWPPSPGNHRSVIRGKGQTGELRMKDLTKYRKRQTSLAGVWSLISHATVNLRPPYQIFRACGRRGRYYWEIDGGSFEPHIS